MKKCVLVFISIILVVVSVFSIVGCSDEGSTTPIPTTPIPTTVKLTKENYSNYLIISSSVDLIEDTGLGAGWTTYRRKFSGTIAPKKRNYTFNDVVIELVYSKVYYPNDHVPHTCVLSQDGEASFVFYEEVSRFSQNYDSTVYVFSISGTVVIE